MKEKNNESAENYLETILVLSKRLPVVRSVDVANQLDFKKSSVSIAMKNLREKNHITVTDAGYIYLTESGKAIADMIYERHQLLTSCLEKLGVSAEIAEKDACKIEHVISKESFEAIKEYVKAESLEQAYELNQKRTNCILGGMLWLKMVTRNVQKAIDLSGLGLDQIEENDEEFSIGAMVTLRQIELHEGLNTWSQGAVKESVTHIVGVQFRNLATVGGSIFGKFGFSDVLSCFLAFDSYVELHHEGIIPLDQFAANKCPNDILVRLIIKKHPQESVYLSHRNTKTDFPVLTCAVSLGEKEAYAVVGARPSRACRVRLSDQWMEQIKDDEGRKKLADEVTGQMNFGSNMRGSAAYREQLSKVLLRRGFEQLEERREK